MAYQYKDWTLYTIKVDLKGGHTQQTYFFSKGKPKSGVPCDLPDGWAVKESLKKGSGMPYLKKK